MVKPIYTSHSIYNDAIDINATVDNVKNWLNTDYIRLVEQADTSYLYVKGYRISHSNTSPANNGNTTDQRYNEHIRAKEMLNIFDEWLHLCTDDQTRRGLEARYIVGKKRKGVPVDYKKLKRALLSIADFKRLVILDDPCCKNMTH